MVKAYLRYEPAGAFGVVTSGCAPVYDASGKLLISAALENVIVWNVKQGSQVGCSPKAIKRRVSCILSNKTIHLH
jgi:U3 small nucleolar RNA-associated protein 12